MGRRSSAVGCPTCSSPEPHLHPEGEVCSDTFHLRETEENTREFRNAVHRVRGKLGVKRYYVGSWQRDKEDTTAWSFVIVRQTDDITVARNALRKGLLLRDNSSGKETRR